MSLTRTEVEKVSLLARLQLSDHELTTMTAQLGQIVAYVEQLAELDTEDVEPMAHAVESFNVFAADRAAPSLERERAPGQRSETRRGVLSRARRFGGLIAVGDWSPRRRRTSGRCPLAQAKARSSELPSILHPAVYDSMSLIHLTAVELLRRLQNGEAASVEVVRSYLDRIQKHDGAIRAFLRVDADGALERAEEIDRRRSRGRTGWAVWAGCPWPSRTCSARRRADHVRLADARALPAAVRCHGHRAAQGGRRRAPRQDEHGRVRHGRLDRELGLSARRATPGTSSAIPGGSSGGAAACVAAGMAPLVGRQRHGRLDPPAGRVLRRDRPEADLRPRQPLRPGRVRQQSRSDRSAGAQRPKTRRCCWKSSPATIRWIRPRSTCPVPDYTQTGPAAARRAAAGRGPRAFWRRARRRGRSGRARGGARLRIARRDGPRDLAAAQQVRRGHVLHHRAVRSLEQSGPLRRRPLRLSHRRDGDGGRAGTRSASSSASRGDEAGLDRLDRPAWSACIAAAGPKVLGRR